MSATEIAGKFLFRQLKLNIKLSLNIIDNFKNPFRHKARSLIFLKILLNLLKIWTLSMVLTTL